MIRATQCRGPVLLAAVILIASPAAGQTPITRAEAITAALARGGAGAVARADAVAAAAGVTAARAYPDPSLSAAYSKDAPQRHVLLTLPLDLPWVRSPRIHAAELTRSAAGLQLEAARAAIRLEADTTYTAALAAAARRDLSSEDALAADSLLAMTRAREEAGDASALDVALAEVSAGQLTNQAAADSLAVQSALLELQRVMGLDSAQVSITPADTLSPPAAVADSGAAPLPRSPEALAAAARLTAAEASLAFERSNRIGVPSLDVGFDWHDPTQSGLLPTIGLSLPLPLFDRNRGAVAQASAALDRARAELLVSRRSSETALLRARRELDGALRRLARDRRVLDAARRVATMSLTAYREGASALPAVLEARRTARDALGQYVSDLSAAASAAALVRYYTEPAGGSP